VRNNERYRGLGSRNGRSRCDQSGGNECCKFSEHRNNAVSIMGRERVSPLQPLIYGYSFCLP
jgi:hypothetical protein